MKKMLVLAILTIAFVSQAQAQNRGGVGERAGKSEAVRVQENQRTATRAAGTTVKSEANRAIIATVMAKVQDLRSKGLIESQLERPLAARLLKDPSLAGRIDAALKSGKEEELTIIKLELVRSSQPDANALMTKGAEYQVARESAVELESAVKQAKGWTGSQKSNANLFGKLYAKARSEGLNELAAMEQAARQYKDQTKKEIDWKKIRELCKA